MNKHSVHIIDSSEDVTCREDQNVLRSMEQLGRKGIPVGCRNGGCGVCKVRVVEGDYTAKVMSRAHVSEAEEAQGCVLACRIFPRSDLNLTVIGKMNRAFGLAAATSKTSTLGE